MTQKRLGTNPEVEVSGMSKLELNVISCMHILDCFTANENRHFT